MLFGHNLRGWTCFGHHLDKIWSLVTFLDTFWTLLRVLRPKCVYPLIVLQHRIVVALALRAPARARPILIRTENIKVDACLPLPITRENN